MSAYSLARAASTSRLISVADAATAGCVFIDVVITRVSTRRLAPIRALTIVRSPLFDQRNLLRELVVHEGPHLVLDLVQTGDLLGRKHLLEARDVRAEQRDVSPLERQVVREELCRRLVAHRVVRLAVGVDQLQELVDAYGKAYNAMSDETATKLLADYLALERANV